MKNMKIRQGARLYFTVNRADDEAISATFIMQLQSEDEDVTIDVTEEYDENGVATFEIDDTEVVGTYDYQVNENFTSGNPDIYPSLDDCEGDGNCDFPTVEICESIQLGSS